MTSIHALSETFTRSSDTEQRYLERASRLLATYQEESRNTDASVPSWLESNAHQFSKATLRQYKAALAYHFEAMGEESVAAQIRAIATDNCRASKEKRRTSAKKLKGVSATQEALLHKELLTMSKGQHWGPRTYIWLKATLLTGLRPVEWKTARMLQAADGARTLQVTNAKNSNQRAHGTHRHLNVELLSEKELTCIWLQLTYVNAESDQGLINAQGEKLPFETYYHNIRRSLEKTSRRLHPRRDRHVSIYSARHQFIANLKKAGVPLSEIAALVGHANDLTASSTYGKRRSGSSRSGLPLANPEEVARVRQVYTGIDQSPTVPQGPGHNLSLDL